jgi:hypothetical protein
MQKLGVGSVAELVRLVERLDAGHATLADSPPAMPRDTPPVIRK